MHSAVASKLAAPRGHRPASRKLVGAEMGNRLEQIELTTVSALRALQMDIGGDKGVPSAEVLRKARASLR